MHRAGVVEESGRKVHKKRWKLGALLAIVAIAAVVALAQSDPYLFRCLVLSRFLLDEIEPGVYVEPTMGSLARVDLQSDVRHAGERVQGLFGDQIGEPVILAGELETFRRFGAGAGDDFSITRTSPIADYIVIGRHGENVDCISHEMAHVEFHARLGWWKYHREAIPAWFEEGAAMYVDDRPAFTEEQYQRVTNHGATALPLNTIATKADFYGGDRYRAYLTAKHVFAEWYRSAHREGLAQLVSRVRDGEDFESVYAEFQHRAQAPAK